MVALNFPDSPTDGQEYGGYVYDATVGAWNRLPTLPALDLVEFSAVAPSNPQDGQFWFDTNAGKMYVYYNDGSSAQWVSTIGGLASQTGSEGQFLIHDGTEWLASEFTSPGSVLQVVSTTKTDTFSASVAPRPAIGSEVTGLSATITPKSSSSKLLVMGSLIATSSAADRAAYVHIFRDGLASDFRGDAAGNRQRTASGYTSAASDISGPSYSFQFLDDAVYTSSTTYSIHLSHGSSGTSTVYVNRSKADTDDAQYGRSASSITIMEIAG